MDAPAPPLAPADVDDAVRPVFPAPRASTVALVILATLGVFYTLYFAAGIVLPLLFAAVLNLLLAPVKRLMTQRLRLPGPAAALLLILALFGVLFGVGFAVSVPASNWIARAPESIGKLEDRLSFLREPISYVRGGLEKLEAVVQPPPRDGQTLTVRTPSSLGGVGISVLESTRLVLGQALTLGVTLFFLLAAGDTLLRSAVEVLPSFGDKRRLVEIATEIERNISGYLATVTAMNLLVGVANGLSMWLLGMPDPLLWGTVAFLLNYIPILGPIVGMVIFFVVALFTVPTIVGALVPPAIYFGVHVVEGEMLTPMLLARRFTLNPVLVIVSLFFWDWMWGVPGALLAVPLLAIAKIIADRLPGLGPLGHLLGGSPRGDVKSIPG